jgi:hypothetical protein
MFSWHIVQVPLRLDIDMIGSSLVKPGEANNFELACTSNIGSSTLALIEWFKDDFKIKDWNLFKMYNRSGAHLNSYLQFNLKKNTVSQFDGVYTCRLTVILDSPRNSKNFMSEPYFVELQEASKAS